VPDPVIDRMLHKWEVPSPLEAHEVRYLVQDEGGRVIEHAGTLRQDESEGSHRRGTGAAGRIVSARP